MDVGSSKFIYRFSPYVALVLGQMGGSRSVMLVHGKKGLVYSLN